MNSIMRANELHHHYGPKLISDMDTRQFPLDVCAENFVRLIW
jgi:hypothetical protein